jgi:hypothetical protein
MKTLNSRFYRPAFKPRDTRVISIALDEVCRDLGISEADKRAQEVIAERIVELARCGERNPWRLRARCLRNPDQLRRHERYRPCTSLQGVKIGRRCGVNFARRLTPIGAVRLGIGYSEE